MASRGFSAGISTLCVPRMAKFVGRRRLIVGLYVLYLSIFTCYYLLPEERPLYVMFIVLCLHGVIEGPISTLMAGKVKVS